ncbi:unnamed protein product [Xylocopa violacea]|uniref:Uncharacterized protein n=2 Tax=Xylocopa violacea TaxID=135666 RepID=A0ABP1N8Z4_XYLVO
MNTIGTIFSFFTLVLVVLSQNVAQGDIVAGYVPGISGMISIDDASCLNDELRNDASLSNPLECARTCQDGQTKTCYYKFVIERYPVNGKACDSCMPNITNTLCPNCQCVPGDGIQRMALTVNRMIPGPTVQVCKGDYVVVDVVNQMPSDSVTVHWHGIFQNGSPHQDGVPHLTQCPILMHNTFRYQFYANNSGTHLWHAHTALQKLDGIFGSFIVRDPPEHDPHSHLYDFDLANHVILMNDWFPEESISRFPGRRAGLIRQHAESILINGKGRYADRTGATTNISAEVITVEANKRYRFRLINSICTVCPGQFTIEGHKLTVIATDGQPIKPVVVDSIISLAGERYDFIVTTNQKPGAFWIQVRALDECVENSVQQLAVLQYEGAVRTPKTEEPTYFHPLPSKVTLDVAGIGCFNSAPGQVCISEVTQAVPVDPIILKEPDVKLVLPIGVHNYEDEEIFTPNTYNNFLVPSPRKTVTMWMNNISSLSPPAPPLTQLEDIPAGHICNADNLPPKCNSTSVCPCIHVIKIPLNAVVEVALIDEFDVPMLRHPFHLHGYAFHVVGMGQPLGPMGKGARKLTAEYFKYLDERNQLKRNLISPPGKDTIPIPNNGYTIFRFRADNPGFWIFHCHELFHVMGGMELTFQVGEVTDFPKAPENFPRCGNFRPKIRV